MSILIDGINSKYWIGTYNSVFCIYNVSSVLRHWVTVINVLKFEFNDKSLRIYKQKKASKWMSFCCTVGFEWVIVIMDEVKFEFNIWYSIIVNKKRFWANTACQLNRIFYL